MKENERREKEVTREIKFRGKAKMSIEELNELGLKHENGWVYGHLVMYGKTPYIVGDFIEVDSEYTVNEFWVEVISDTVGQFTGLKDKNGRKIYEGDIIKVGEYTINEVEGYYNYGKICYYKNGDLLVIVSLFPIMDVRCIEDYQAHIKNDGVFSLNGYRVRPRANSYEIWNFQRSLEVIGNIHDKTELLEVK